MTRDDWKRHHADQSERALEHELVQKAMREFAMNMGFDLEGLPYFGLAKIASHAAQVARAQALGFDPDLLRLTPGEADAETLKVAAAASKAGIPVWVLDDKRRGGTTS